MALWTLTATTWSDPLPINVYVIEHANGTVLFDTGQDEASQHPGYYPEGLMGFLYRRQARFTVAPEQNLGAQLKTFGVEVDDVRFAAISHLHQDHVGGVAQLPNAQMLVSTAEFALLGDKNPYMHGVMPEHVTLPGVQYSPVVSAPNDDPSLAPFTEAHAIFADYSLMLLPTPGHTPGSMSLLVRRDGHVPLLLVGDVTYDADLLAAGRVPGTGATAQKKRRQPRSTRCAKTSRVSSCCLHTTPVRQSCSPRASRLGALARVWPASETPRGSGQLSGCHRCRS
jgi:N-acyl homoserine lactone hydrolase